MTLGCVLAFAACGSSNSNSQPGKVTGPPQFTSTAPMSAEEGVAYSYTISATDPAGGTVTLALGTVPTGATLSGNTLTWTPTHSQSRSANTFTINATTSEGQTASQNWTLTPTGTINGTVVDTYVTKDGNQSVPVDVSGATLAAYVPDGSGGYTKYSGTGASSGTFNVPGVPAGNFAIGWTNPGNPTIFVFTDASDVDFGQAHLGRPNPQQATQGVTVDLTLALATPVSPPEAAEQYQLYSPDVNFLDTFEGTISGTPPVFTANLTEFGSLIEGSSFSDQTYVTRAKQTLPTAGKKPPAGLVTEYFGPSTTVSEIDGGTVHIGTSTSPEPMVTANTTTTVEINVAGGQFAAALAGAIPPTASTQSTTFQVGPQPYDATQGPVGQLLSLLTYPFGSAALITDIDAGSLPVMNPVPSSTLIYDYSQQSAIPVNVLPAMVFGPSAEIRTVTTVSPTTSTRITPMVGPVSATINGQSFFNNQSSSPVNPTIAWSAPKRGTPTAYMLRIFYVNPTGGPVGTGSVDEQLDFILPTSVLSVPLPSGFLQSGSTYVFTISALDDPSGPDITVAPLRKAFPYGYATSVSGEITVQ